MRTWLWGILLLMIGGIPLTVIYTNTGSLKSTIPYLDVISAILAIIAGIGFIAFVIGVRSWHK